MNNDLNDDEFLDELTTRSAAYEELRSKIEWGICLDAPKYGAWHVGYNPIGEGLALFVDRGIPCEFHRQIISAHCTNTPEKDDIQWVVDTYRDEWATSINNFIMFVNSLHKSNGSENVNYEAYSSLFCTTLIKEIASRAEQRFL